MKKHFLFLSLLTSLFFLHSCQKELSNEPGGTPSEGSLQSDVTGDCLPKTVEGIYEAGTPLDGTANYIDVVVDVTVVGGYEVYTDTLNGVFFRATGVFTNTGLNTVRLAGSGVPVNEGVDTYVVTYNATSCVVAVATLPEGGADPAEFTLVSAGAGECSAFNLSGNYIKDVPLTSPSNTVDLQVSVTTMGTYDITTTASNGIVFSGTGVVTTATTTITLTASGTPAAIGATNVVVTAGSSTCNFNVDVVGPAAFTINCGSATINGTYEEGVMLDGSNTVDIEVDVTGVGGYSITGTINGMTFSDDGMFTNQGIQTITLHGSGTPTADGSQLVPLTMAETAACTVEVIVNPGTTIPATDLNWSITEGAATIGGPVDDILSLDALESTGITGKSADGTLLFSLTLSRTGGVGVGTYSSTAEEASLSVMPASLGLPVYVAASTVGNLTVIVTAWDQTSGGVAQGTFTGTVMSASGSQVSISGAFKGKMI